jgi:hypothetical protein
MVSTSRVRSEKSVGVRGQPRDAHQLSGSFDLDAGDETMFDGDVRGRKKLDEVFGHVVVISSAFEIVKHLGGELAGGGLILTLPAPQRSAGSKRRNRGPHDVR